MSIRKKISKDIRNSMGKEDRIRQKDVACKDVDGETKTIRVCVENEIIERTIDKKGKALIFSDIEVNTWCTNLE